MEQGLLLVVADATEHIAGMKSAVELLLGAGDAQALETNEGEWEDGEQLVLLDERRTSLTVEGDLLLLAKNQSGFVAEILKLAGITAGPS